MCVCLVLELQNGTLYTVSFYTNNLIQNQTLQVAKSKTLHATYIASLLSVGFHKLKHWGMTNFDIHTHYLVLCVFAAKNNLKPT